MQVFFIIVVECFNLETLCVWLLFGNACITGQILPKFLQKKKSCPIKTFFNDANKGWNVMRLLRA